MKRFAAIDIGTNTTLLIIAELSQSTLLSVVEHAEITRLGRGVGASGKLAKEAITQTLSVLETYARFCREHEVSQLAAVGTAALRDAQNGNTFLQEAKQILGSPVEVISGEEEARLAALAIARAFPSAGKKRIVFDIGGGSTELILQEESKILGRHSYPIGSVKLTERHLKNDPPGKEELQALLADAKQSFSSLPFSAIEAKEPSDMVGMAGTVTTLCAIAQKLSPYDPEKIHGAVLSKAVLQEIWQNLSSRSVAERKKTVGLSPKRADVILAGAAIQIAILERFSANHMLVSDHGIRHGLLWDRFFTKT